MGRFKDRFVRMSAMAISVCMLLVQMPVKVLADTGESAAKEIYAEEPSSAESPAADETEEKKEDKGEAGLSETVQSKAARSEADEGEASQSGTDNVEAGLSEAARIEEAESKAGKPGSGKNEAGQSEQIRDSADNGKNQEEKEEIADGAVLNDTAEPESKKEIGALEAKEADFEPDEVYTVEVSLQDSEGYDIRPWYDKALIWTDSSCVPKMEIFLTKSSWNNNELESLKLEGADRVIMNKGSLNTVTEERRTITGTVIVEGIDRNTSSYSAYYTSTNQAEETPAVFSVSWSGMVKGDSSLVPGAADGMIYEEDEKPEKPDEGGKPGVGDKEVEQIIAEGDIPAGDSEAPIRFSVKPGEVSEGTELIFEHDGDALIGIFYTVDGSDPTDKNITPKTYSMGSDPYVFRKGKTDTVVIRASAYDYRKPQGQKYSRIVTATYRVKSGNTEDKPGEDKPGEGGPAPGVNPEEELSDGIFYNSELRINEDEEYDTIILYTKSDEFNKGTKDAEETDPDKSRKILSTAEFYMELTQQDTKERCVYNGGIGGFTVPYDEESGRGKVIINILREQFDYSEPLELHIVEKGCQDTIAELDLTKTVNIVKTQERKSGEEASESRVLDIREMENGGVYTASFKAVRIDDETRDSMLAGFFDRSVRLDVGADGTVTAKFYNTVFAHSMIDFAICGEDGQWQYTSLNGEKEEESGENGKVIAASYELKIPDPRKNKYMTGAVNVLAMGGSDQMNGHAEQYTKVKMIMDDTVREGFTDFESKNNRLSQNKLINRALMTLKGIDRNGDGYVSRTELSQYKFPEKLDLSLHVMYSNYNIHDNFDLSDIGWLKLIGNPKKIKSINFSEMKIGRINDEFKTFTNLHSLDLSANVIAEIEEGAFENNGKLATLRLSQNMLTSISGGTFKGLKGLKGAKGDEDSSYNGNFDLSGNQISEIEAGAFDDMSDIKSFDFNGNVIERFDAAEIFAKKPERVRALGLSENKLTQVPENLAKLKGLAFISLDKNQIYDIGDRLDGIGQVNTIYLSENQLREIPDSLIDTNARLKNLYTDKNSIEAIPEAMLKKMTANESGFDSIFQNNALDIKNCNTDLLSSEGKAKLEELILQYASKAAFAPKVSAVRGRIEFSTDISALDYYIWARTKEYKGSREITDAVESVLGEGRRIDSAEDLRRFREVNLPNLELENVQKSILTDITGTVDSLSIKTEIQKLGGGRWFTVEEWTDPQSGETEEGVLHGEYTDSYASDNDRYRLLYTVKSSVNSARGQVYAYYFTNSGSTDNIAGKNPDTSKPSDNSGISKAEAIDAFKRGIPVNGVYTVSIRMKKAADIERKQYSMADKAAPGRVIIEVKDGQPYIRTSFEGMNVQVSAGREMFGYLGELSYYTKGYVYSKTGIPQGSREPAEILSVHMKDGTELHDKYNKNGKAYPKELRFPITDLNRALNEGYIPLHVFVPIMEAIAKKTGDQDVLMEFDWNTLDFEGGTDKAGSINLNDFKKDGNGTDSGKSGGSSEKSGDKNTEKSRDNEREKSKGKVKTGGGFEKLDNLIGSKTGNTNNKKSGLAGLGSDKSSEKKTDNQNTQSVKTDKGSEKAGLSGLGKGNMPSGSGKKKGSGGKSPAAAPDNRAAAVDGEGEVFAGLDILSEESGLYGMDAENPEEGYLYEEAVYTDGESEEYETEEEQESGIVSMLMNAGRKPGAAIGFWSAAASYLAAGIGALIYRRRRVV